MCRKHLVSMLLGLVVVALLSAPVPARAVPPALTPVTACGQILSTAGQYMLAVNLDCSGMKNKIGITITASNVVFHLAGHTIQSTDCDLSLSIVAISVDGTGVAGGISGVEVEGGTVTGFNDGVFLNVVSNSRVHGMTVSGACAFGIVVANSARIGIDTDVVTGVRGDGVGIGGTGKGSTAINVTANHIFANTRAGVGISNPLGSKITVSSNTIDDNGGAGVAVFAGNRNTITENAVNGNSTGIDLQSSGNTVATNTVNRSSNEGIAIEAGGSGNTVRSNTALGNTVLDLSDGNAGCPHDSNTWKANVFVTASPCI